MNAQDIITGVLVKETTTFSFGEVCQKYHIPEELLLELIEYGLFDTQTTQRELIQLDQKNLKNMEIAFRLHRDLKINLPGVALAVDLLSQIDHMHQELEILRKHFSK